MLSQVETITVDGVGLCVDSVGEGDPVVCLHAVGHDARDFDPLAERLGRRYRFIRIEWPGGLGRSAPDHEKASARRYAELAEGVIDALGLENPVLLGNSIGGAASILIASRRPVRGVVLCSSGGLVEITKPIVALCRFFEGFFAAGERGAWWYDPAFALYYSRILRSPAAREQRRRIVRAGRKSAPILRQAWASFARPEADVREIAARLEVRVWAVWTTNEAVVPLKYCRPAIDRIRGSRLSIFDGGHAAFLEQPDAFAADFAEFMRSLPSTARDASTLARAAAAP
jgi:4,5:9,10-diseco-3-hydroxy-5,9,17-trioxoandrosta-1(10),2-diene-4-oate hydrolase